MSSSALIRRCQNGDRAAFNELVTEQYDVIYRIAFKWCSDQHNAEDIAQLACIKLAKSIQQFRFEASFSSWLYRLVVNCAKDFYKSPTHSAKDQSTTPSQNESQNADQAKQERLHYARQILEHIGHLPQDLQDALVLVFGNGLNHKQAAKELNIKESTVSWRVHEARKLLKATFESATLNEHTPTTAGGAV